MAIGLDPKVNPYQGNPYLYGYGPEHRWFTYGDIAPPAAPGEPAPAPQTPPLGQQAIPPSIFEGDGARDGGEGMFNDLEWEPAKPGPRMADVMAALAAAGQPTVTSGPEMRVDAPPSFDPLEQSFAGYANAPSFSDEVGMMADRAAEEIALGERAMTRAHEFEEPNAPAGALAAPAMVEAPAAPGVAVGPSPQGFEMSAPIGIGGIQGRVGTDLRGWGESIGGQGQGALAGLAESAIGAMGGGTGSSVNPADFVNSPQGQAAMAFTEGLLSRSADQFGKFGEDKATNALVEGKSPIAGTHDYMSSLVDPNRAASAPVAPAEYGYAPAPPAYSDLPGYSPSPTVIDTTPVVDQELIDNTPSFDQYGNPIGKAGDKISGLENLVDLTHLAEIIDPSAGALGLAGLNEDQLAGADLYGDYSDGLYGGSNVGSGGYVGGRGGENESFNDMGYGGYGTDPIMGLTDTQIADLVSAYNDAAPAVGQASPVAGFSTAIEAMQTANELGATGTTGGTAPGGRENLGGYDKGSTPGQEASNSSGSDGSTGGGGCYITTAAVDHMKLKDDGAHLKILRWYRDNVLAKTPEGRKQILEYKRVAPKIVQALNKRKDAPEVYKALFTSYIDPAAQAVVNGNYEDADKLYSSMVKQVADLS